MVSEPLEQNEKQIGVRGGRVLWFGVDWGEAEATADVSTPLAPRRPALKTTGFGPGDCGQFAGKENGGGIGCRPQ